MEACHLEKARLKYQYQPGYEYIRNYFQLTTLTHVRHADDGLKIFVDSPEIAVMNNNCFNLDGVRGSVTRLEFFGSKDNEWQ